MRNDDEPRSAETLHHYRTIHHSITPPPQHFTSLSWFQLFSVSDFSVLQSVAQGYGRLRKATEAYGSLWKVKINHRVCQFFPDENLFLPGNFGSTISVN